MDNVLIPGHQNKITVLVHLCFDYHYQQPKTSKQLVAQEKHTKTKLTELARGVYMEIRKK